MRFYALVKKDNELTAHVVEDDSRKNARERITWAFPRPAEIVDILDDPGLADLINMLQNATPLKQSAGNPNGCSRKDVGEWTFPPRLTITPH
jgi:hypothetical protein